MSQHRLGHEQNKGSEGEQMKIIEPKEVKCKECGKIRKDKSEGIGIPVYKGLYFVREWTCLSCFKKEFRKKLGGMKE